MFKRSILTAISILAVISLAACSGLQVALPHPRLNPRFKSQPKNQRLSQPALTTVRFLVVGQPAERL